MILEAGGGWNAGHHLPKRHHLKRTHSGAIVIFLAHDLFLFLLKENNKKCPTHNTIIE